jgi:AbrB family looped-hinge helix DNA binding protein
MIAEKKDKGECCYNIESVVTVDERGQMVLPKEIRNKAGIKAGDKLAVVLMEKEGKVCCLSLVKAENFSQTVKDLLE